jgi:hypothetical protein
MKRISYRITDKKAQIIQRHSKHKQISLQHWRHNKNQPTIAFSRSKIYRMLVEQTGIPAIPEAGDVRPRNMHSGKPALVSQFVD